MTPDVAQSTLSEVKSIKRRCGLLLTGALALSFVIPLQSAAADPVQPDGSGTVGTAVHVIVRKSFTEITGPDECVGASPLAAIHRGGTVVLSEASPASSDTPKVAIGGFFRSRMKDGNCEVLYVISAPAMPAFNVQFFDLDGERSPTFGPVGSEPVTDQPGILQAVRVDLDT